MSKIPIKKSDKMPIKKAIIAVAGFGTRFLPATKAQPKEMLPIVDKPVVQFIVEEVVNSGIKEVVFVTGRGKHAIENHFDYSVELENALKKSGKDHLYEEIKRISDMANFAYVRQKESKGNGDALLIASHLIEDDEPCAVLFGDDLVDAKVPVIAQLSKIYEKYNASVIALEKVPAKDIHKYGVVKAKKIADRLYQIEDIVEKPRADKAPSNLAVVGKYIVTPDVFEALRDLKVNLKKNFKGELGITDAFKEILKTRPVYGVEFEGTRYDCGSKIGFLKAIVDHALKHPEVKDEFKSYLKSKKI